MRKGKKLSKILRARELRKEATCAEQILWEHLRDRKFFNKKFRRQHIFRGFIVDFYCFEDKIAIELDGSIHLKQKDYDKARQNLIRDYGIEIIRFKNLEVISNISKILNIIRDYLTVPSPSMMEREGEL